MLALLAGGGVSGLLSDPWWGGGWGRQGRRFLTQCSLWWQAELALGLVMGLRAAVGSLGRLGRQGRWFLPQLGWPSAGETGSAGCVTVVFLHLVSAPGGGGWSGGKSRAQGTLGLVPAH